MARDARDATDEDAQDALCYGGKCGTPVAHSAMSRRLPANFDPDDFDTDDLDDIFDNM